MKYAQTLVPFDGLTLADNPRIPTNLALDSLMESIENVGLLEPITVWEPQKGKLEVVRGHRRTMSIGLLRNRNSKRFDELFAKGIPALKVTDVTADEVVELKLDHSEQKGLSDPHELQRSANMLFNIGKTENEVAVILAGLIDKISPMNSKAKLQLETLKSKVEAMKATKNSAAVELAEREVKDFIGAYRRGFVQNLHNTFRCPEKVMWALYKKATGQAPDGVTEYLPKLGAVQVTALWKAHKADLEERENGVPKYNKQRVGPKFTAKWNELIADEKKAIEEGEDKEPRQKAMSAKDMEAEVKEGKYKSELACKLTAHHCGDKGIDDLSMLDDFAYKFDLVRKHDKDLTAMVIESAKAIEKRLIEADQAAKAKEVEKPQMKHG